MSILRAVTLAVALIAAVIGPALADITGPARIIDGDTIDIAGERIRLHGIDAPEAAQTCVAGGVTWPCGQSATAALAEFIGGAAVSCRARGTDKYGRTIATCYVQGEDIEAWMVLNGWALAYRRYSLEYVDEEAAGAKVPYLLAALRTSD